MKKPAVIFLLYILFTAIIAYLLEETPAGNFYEYPAGFSVTQPSDTLHVQIAE